MKKISLLVIGIASAIFSFSQTQATFGVKAGLNIASLKIQNFNNTDSRFGAHAGVFAHIHLAPEWALQPEAVYSAEGGKANFGGGEEATYKNDYINIPLMLQYMFDNGFRIEAGPQLGLLVSSKIEDQDGNESDAKDSFKSTNVAIGFGLGYLTYSGFGFGGRYNLGVSNIAKGSGDVKGSALQVSLFYMFNHNHKAQSK